MNFRNKLLILVAIFAYPILQADMITKINTIRKMDAHVRQFLGKTSEIGRAAGSLKGKFKCVKKKKDNQLLAVCPGRGCKNLEQCMFNIFKEYVNILDPIMKNLVGTIETGSGKLKPGALTALPLLWDEPKPDSITKMQKILVDDVAVPLNDLMSFMKMMRDALDPDFVPQKKMIPAKVNTESSDEADLDKAPLPADADENATAPSASETATDVAAASAG